MENKYLKRALELGLNFDECYFILMGDYPDNHSAIALDFMFKDELITMDQMILLQNRSVGIGLNESRNMAK